MILLKRNVFILYILINLFSSFAIAQSVSSDIDSNPFLMKQAYQKTSIKGNFNFKSIRPNLEGWPFVQGNPSEVSHMPWVIGNVGSVLGNEAITTRNEVLFDSDSSHLMIVKSNGYLLFDLPLKGVGSSFVSLGDLDQDGENEIVVPSRGAVNLSGLFLVNVHADQIQETKLLEGHVFSHIPVVLEDVNGDGKLEIIALEVAFLGKGSSIEQRAKIHVVDMYGNSLPGWPKTIPGFPFGDNSKILTSPFAVGDLDKDGKKEIVIQVKDSANDDAPIIYAFRFDGTVMWSYQVPYPYQNFYVNFNDIFVFNDLILADADHDGFLNVIYNFESERTLIPRIPRTNIFVLNHLGKPMYEWTAETSGNIVFDFPGLQQMGIGDLDNDGDLEIIMNGYAINPRNLSVTYAWHHNGELLNGFPVVRQNGEDKTSAPMTGDVDNDGFLDIVSSLYFDRDAYFNKIYAYDRSGKILDDWPILLLRQYTPSRIVFNVFEQTTLNDLDGDGKLDLIAPIGSAESYAVKLSVPNKRTLIKGWPMYRHDNKRTGRLDMIDRRIVNQ